jgi:hypothetical protein
VQGDSEMGKGKLGEVDKNKKLDFKNSENWQCVTYQSHKSKRARQE